MRETADVAVVVPVHDDAPALAALLDALDAGSRAPRDIVVVSSRADAALEALCRARGCRCLVAADSRGARLDRGARAAQASVLWFLHADAVPAPEALAAIGAASAAGAESGCFRFRLLGPRTWYKRALEAGVAARVRAGGMCYGDQGLFARRDAYLACGGFAHQPLFEEVPLVKRLRARGTFRPLPVPIGVSPRRWERDGWWRRTLHNRWLALCYLAGVPPARLARKYRRGLGSGERRLKA